MCLCSSKSWVGRTLKDWRTSKMRSGLQQTMKRITTIRSIGIIYKESCLSKKLLQYLWTFNICGLSSRLLKDGAEFNLDFLWKGTLKLPLWDCESREITEEVLVMEESCRDCSMGASKWSLRASDGCRSLSFGTWSYLKYRDMCSVYTEKTSYTSGQSAWQACLSELVFCLLHQWPH